ncbi:TonB-dependent receptor [Blastomonas aquatica]|uniref:TonB-dependent receptor n=1 Tax=Blastomonas aquatica TaxID=1510276 RepID=A0ABQ1JPY7_9SPHN|nr:TonB-dependent receptor [Blastomonas aquatica]GGB74618.1 TonB-dependent receptor [Blastomonas aquatica]
MNTSYRAGLLAGAALCLMASMPAFAQSSDTSMAATETGQIGGVVVDSNGNLVAGATVQVEGSNLVATTGTDGRFVIRSAPVGEVRVRVRYFGSDPVEQTVSVTAQTAAEMRVTVGGSQTVREDGQIVVTASRPIAESEAAALQLQRSSNALVSVIAADSIGRFPDQNIAASLGRLPGVAVQRDQGQDRFISLRGARTNWTTISFDGINVISPAGRTTRFDTIPSAIASKVAVRKAVTADLTGEAVAGQVDILTRSAFDYPGLKVAADLGLGFSELGGGRQYNVTTHVSDRFFNDTIGILLSASRFEVDMITDNFEAGWEIAPEDRLPGSEARIWANNTQNKLYRLTRSNTAFSGRLDWRPSNDHQFFLSSVHTEFRDDELRSAYVFDFDDGAVRTDSTAPQLTARRTGYADIRTGNTPFNGTLFGAEIDSTLNSNSSRQRIFTNTLGGNHILGEWGASWRLNFTRAQADSRPPFQSTWRSPSSRTQRPSIVYDLSDPALHKVQLYDTLVDANGNFSLGRLRDAITPTELEFVTFTRNNQRDQTDAYTARLDFDREISLFGLDTKIQFGGQFNKRTKESNRTVIEARAADLAAAGIALPSQAAFASNDPLKVGIPLGYSFRYFDSAAGEALLDSYIAAGASRIQPSASENNDYVVTEKIFAGYLMGTMFFDRGNVVAGARVERVDNTGSALVNFGGTFRPVTAESGNTLVFPSVHFNYDATDEIKLRLSVNTGAARPDYTLLRPNFTFSDQTETVSGGNPFATPEKAVGVDAYFEWYMANRGFLSIGVYYKKVRDVLFNSQLPQFGSDVLNSDGIDRSVYFFNTTINGGSGEIKGLEIAYSQPFEGLLRSVGAPEWLQGFGFQGNVTLNDSKAVTPDGRDVALPGASDLIYNASLYYEQYGLSLRASWQKRDAWLDSLGGDPVVGDNFWSSVGRLDLSARYAINSRVEMFVDANNLLDEPGIRYVGDPSRTIEFEKFGARFMAGVRINLGGSGSR